MPSIQKSLETDLLCKQSDTLISDQALEDIFTLQDRHLIVESDKKLGLFILDTKTYLDAHHKINNILKKKPLQRIGTLQISWQFIHDAQATLPTELSNIVNPQGWGYFTNERMGGGGHQGPPWFSRLVVIGRG